MAADQWRKRLNSSSVVACYGREPYRAKRKNSGLPQHDSNMKSHISLEWDGNQKKVVARREQIGISWRDMMSFAGSSPSVNNVVADVIALPHEIYALENLKEVLSYEVWEAYLSESERNHLMQFLPRGSEPEQVLQALLAGDNFHFGSPFLNWGSSLCSGDLHPDAIRQKHQCLKNEKKIYYTELHTYHNNMIDNLLKLKGRFERCKDPQKEIVQKTWRSRNDIDKRISSSANDSRFNVLEDNVVGSSESYSWDVDEKACSSDNQNQSILVGGELHNRLYKKDALKDKIGNASAVSDDVLNIGATSRKGDKRHQQNNSSNDGAKYMSYFKISKTQHELVKNMKQSGKSIQSKSLNRVLGNIDSFNVQPYEVFIEEEQKKLRQHWIQMANKALPAACVNRRNLNSQKQQLRKSLEREIKERLNMVAEKEEGSNNQKTVLEDQIDNGVEDYIPTPEDDEKFVSDSPQQESLQDFSSGKEYNSMEIDSEKETLPKPDDATPSASDSADIGDVDLSQGVELSCSANVWPAANISRSYYKSTASHEYTSDDGLKIAPPKGNEVQQTDLIELESSLQVGEPGKHAIHRQQEDTSFRQSDDASFDSYSNPDRNDVFQSLFKGDGMLIYHDEQKHTGLDFQSANNMIMEDGQFPGHFREQSHPPLPMEQIHKRENDAYVEQNISAHVYPDSSRYLIPRQESLVGADVRDWGVNSVRVPPPPPMQSHLNGELPSWFSSEQNPLRSGWAGSVGPTSVPSQRNGGDQSLYSVLSQCNQLQSSSPYPCYHPVGSSAEQFIPPRSYGIMGGSSSNPGMRMSNVPPQSVEYMNGNGREAGPPLMADDIGWMGLAGHQHSGLQDPMGKPFLRSWNQ